MDEAELTIKLKTDENGIDGVLVTATPPKDTDWDEVIDEVKEANVQLLVVDGGYLAWTFGVDGGKQNAWVLSRQQFNANHGGLIIMDDSQNLHRLKYFPEYKSRRRERGKDDPAIMKRVRRVGMFKRNLFEDTTLRVLMWPGHEADDIIAAICLLNPEITQVIGVDKDLLQIPGIELTKHNHEIVDFLSWKLGQAKTLQPYLNYSDDILLNLVFMGDKSDSVPRLIPPRQLELMVKILKAEDPWLAGVNMFGWDDVVRNLYLTVLPGPWLLEPLPTPELVYELIREGAWWDYATHTIDPLLQDRLGKIFGGEYESDR